MVYSDNGMNNTGVAPTVGGYQYSGMTQSAVKFNSTLTPEQIKRLREKDNKFSLSITEEDMLRAICNHRDETGMKDTLVFDSLTGIARCTICGYEFRPIEPDVSLDSIRTDVERIVDILQTIKLMYIDLPAEAAKEYFPIIALLEKVPQLFEFAGKNMNKHEAFGWSYNNMNMGAVRMFHNLQSMFGSGMMPQQPMPQQPYGMPQPQPMYAPNAFGYAGANPAAPNPAFQMNNGGYVPMTGSYQFTPGQPQPVNAPEAPQTTENTTVTDNVSV